MSNLKSLAIEKEELSLKLDNAITLPNIMNSDRLMNNLSETDMSQLIFEFQKTDSILFYENEALNQIIYSGGLKEIKNNRIGALLASWEGKENLVRLQEVQVAEAQKNLESYLYQNCDFKNLADNLIYYKITGVDSVDSRKGNTNLLYSKEYENYIFQFVAYGSSIKESEYLDFENEKQSLITLIDQELNNIN